MLSAESVIGTPEPESIGGLISNAHSTFITFKACEQRLRSQKNGVQLKYTHNGITCERCPGADPLTPMSSQLSSTSLDIDIPFRCRR